jgi:hypothetical protein
MRTNLENEVKKGFFEEKTESLNNLEIISVSKSRRMVKPVEIRSIPVSA